MVLTTEPIRLLETAISYGWHILVAGCNLPLAISDPAFLKEFYTPQVFETVGV